MGLIIEVTPRYRIRERVRFLPLPKEFREAKRNPAQLNSGRDVETENVLLDINFLRTFQGRGKKAVYLDPQAITHPCAEATSRKAATDLQRFVDNRLIENAITFPLSRIQSDPKITAEGRALVYMFLLRCFWADLDLAMQSGAEKLSTDHLTRGNSLLEKYYAISSFCPEVIDEEAAPLKHEFSRGMVDLIYGRSIVQLLLSSLDHRFCFGQAKQGGYVPLPVKKFPFPYFRETLRRYETSLQGISFI